MKSRFIGALGAASLATAAATFVNGTASAQVLGLTATTRLQSDGNYLVNVWVVVGSSTNVLTSVSGGQFGSITTNAVGGFRQSAATGQGLWAPSGDQSWTTLDSFLTVGGSLNTATGAWTGNGSTFGDPNWIATYTDADTGEGMAVNSFSEPSNTSGFSNPNVNSIPMAAGWFLANLTSPARSLTSLSALGRQSVSVPGRDAAAGTFGMLLAQFHVSGTAVGGGNSTIRFNNMRVFLGSADNQLIPSFTIGHIPAPGAFALVGFARLAGGRRRLA